jgi:hypothetical protein
LRFVVAVAVRVFHVYTWLAISTRWFWLVQWFAVLTRGSQEGIQTQAGRLILPSPLSAQAGSITYFNVQGGVESKEKVKISSQEVMLWDLFGFVFICAPCSYQLPGWFLQHDISCILIIDYEIRASPGKHSRPCLFMIERRKPR